MTPSIRRAEFLSVHSTLTALSIVACSLAAAHAAPPAPKALFPAGWQPAALEQDYFEGRAPVGGRTVTVIGTLAADGSTEGNRKRRSRSISCGCFR